MEQHNAGKPHVKQKLCVGCGQCRKVCAHGAPVITDGKAVIDHDRCVGCGRCIAVCPKNAVQINWDETTTNLNRKIAEYTKAVVDGRPCFHIALVIDVSPNCDCRSENDMPIVPNVGMFASFDPVALDMACVDAVNAQTPCGAPPPTAGRAMRMTTSSASTRTPTGAAVWSTVRSSASAQGNTSLSRFENACGKSLRLCRRLFASVLMGLYVLIEHVPHHLIGVEGVRAAADHAQLHVRVLPEEVHDGLQRYMGGL